eukprot:3713114-Rhodomonas_salina.2
MSTTVSSAYGMPLASFTTIRSLPASRRQCEIPATAARIATLMSSPSGNARSALAFRGMC